MRAMSLLRASIYGVGFFAAVTASLTVAMTIAITGPPTASEMDDLQAFLANAGERLGVLAEHVGAEACVQLPPEATGSLCPQPPTVPQETAPPADNEAIVIEARRSESEESGVPTVEPVTEIIAARETDAALLGAAAGDPRPRTERAAPPPSPRAQAERRSRPQRAAQQRRPQPARATRAPRPPVAVARAAIAPLESPAARALEDLAAAATPEIVAEEPVVEDVGYEEEGQVFEDVWPEESRPAAPRASDWEAQDQTPAYDDEYDQAQEDEAYEEERGRQYAEREARRRYRARMRAYREWRREGW